MKGKNKNLGKYLGPVKFEDTDVEKTPQIGLVNGLAYTSVGGEVLNIEVVTVPGTGRIEIDQEIESLALGASQSTEASFTLSPNAQQIEIGKRYEANMIVTEKLPADISSLIGSNDLAGIDTDPLRIFLAGTNLNFGMPCIASLSMSNFNLG